MQSLISVAFEEDPLEEDPLEADGLEMDVAVDE